MGIMLTEDGALKLARLTKSHIGELLAIIVDGRVTVGPHDQRRNHRRTSHNKRQLY